MSYPVQIERRAAQSYAAVAMRVPMDGLAGAVDQGFPELFGWLASQDIQIAAAPFIRYLVVDMASELQVELGAPISTEISGSERIRPGVLPAGQYVTLRHTGPYDGLVASNTALQEWAQQEGITFDTWETPEGTAWRARVEHYLTNPAAEPDPAKWEVDVAYLALET
jgi:effector-binding domain-containing protein